MTKRWMFVAEVIRFVRTRLRWTKRIHLWFSTVSFFFSGVTRRIEWAGKSISAQLLAVNGDLWFCGAEREKVPFRRRKKDLNRKRYSQPADTYFPTWKSITHLSISRNHRWIALIAAKLRLKRTPRIRCEPEQIKCWLRFLAELLTKEQYQVSEQTKLYKIWVGS